MKGTNLILIAVLLGALFWPQLRARLPLVNPAPAPTPVAPIDVPSANDQEAVKPVITALAGDAELKAKFGTYFTMLARAIAVSPEHFRTVGDLKDHQHVAGALYVKEIPGGAKGFGEAVAAAYGTMLGDENQAIDQASATRAAHALAWACAQ